MLLYNKDKDFFPRLFAVASPILLQNILSASLGFIDVFMIGKLGGTPLAGVGSANDFFFVYNMLIFGLASGSAIFTAQYWGKRDVRSIRSVMGIGLSLTLGIALLFALSAFLFPGVTIRIFSNDPLVIKAGIEYLRIISVTFLMTALGINFSVVLRSTENVIYPMIASFSAVITNTVLNYIFIFGKFGVPAMGIAGAAYATVIARGIELSIILFITYSRKLPAAIRPSDLFSFNRDMLKKYLKRVLPVVGQTVGWSAGYSMFSVIYGHLDTMFLSSFKVAGSVERLCLIFFNGLGSACSIMVGNRIGAGEEEHARGYARNFLTISFVVAVVVSTALIVLRGPISSIYDNLDAMERFYVAAILLVMACAMWAKSLNIMFHVGIFKAGGDTVFSMLVDVGGVWMIGVPIALLAGFVFHLPVYLIAACLTAEELTKAIIGYQRYRSGKWMHNLVTHPATKENIS